MKIAILSSGFFPVIDGITVTLLNRIKKLSQFGHTVLLFCPDYSFLEKIYPDYKIYTGSILPGVTVINLPSTSFLDLEFERNVTRSSYRILLEELEKFKPDIIHVDEPERLFWGFFRIPGVDFAKRYGIPCVSFFHTNFLEYGEDYFPLPALPKLIVESSLKLFLRWLYNFYDLTLVSSDITYKKLLDWKIERVCKADLLGVNLDRYNSALKNKDYWRAKHHIYGIDDKIKLVFLGRLTPDKGWKFTLDAFSKIVDEIDLDKIAAIVVGDGSMRDEITKNFSRFTPNVYFLGRIPPQDVIPLFANADIHVTTSMKETKGLTILEAFAAGIPVIAPRAGGVVDSIRDSWNGFLFTPKDENDFISKLKTLIDNPSLRESMGANARQYVARYSWNNSVQNLLEIWQEQINKKNNAKPKLT